MFLRPTACLSRACEHAAHVCRQRPANLWLRNGNGRPMKATISGGTLRVWLVVLACTLTGIANSGGYVLAEEPSVSLGHPTQDEEGWHVPIVLDGFNDLGAITVSLEWDPSVFQVEVVDGTLPGDAILGDPTENNPVRISYFVATGFTGNAVLAHATLLPIATRDSTLTLYVNVCVDTSANAIDLTTSHDVITLAASAGDSPADSQSSTQQQVTEETQPSWNAPTSDATHRAAGDSPYLVWQRTETHGDMPQSGSRFLAISSPLVSPNEEVAVSAILCNVGEDSASKIVTFVVNRSTEETREVHIEPGDCQSIVFTLSRTLPGTYEVAIDDLGGRFTVLPADAAPPPPPGGEVVPPSAQTGIGTPVILAIVGVMLLLIAALVFFFRRT